MTLPAYRDGYYFTEIFFLTGQHMFGRKWTGHEFQASPIEAPEEVRRKHGDAQSALDREAEFRRTQDEIIQRTTNSEVIAAAQAELEKSSERMIGLNKRRYNDLPEIDAQYIGRYEAYNRKTVVMDLLLLQLQSGNLSASAGGLVVPSEMWAGERGFRFYPELNLVVLPRNLFGVRRSLVTFAEKEFQNWLAIVQSSPEKDAEELTPEEWCERLFLALVAEHPGRPKARKLIFSEMKENVPKLSERAFGRVWDRCAPESWKEPGAPKKGN